MAAPKALYFQRIREGPLPKPPVLKSSAAHIYISLSYISNHGPLGLQSERASKLLFVIWLTTKHVVCRISNYFTTNHYCIVQNWSKSFLLTISLIWYTKSPEHCGSGRPSRKRVFHRKIKESNRSALSLSLSRSLSLSLSLSTRNADRMLLTCNVPYISKLFYTVF